MSSKTFSIDLDNNSFYNYLLNIAIKGATNDNKYDWDKYEDFCIKSFELSGVEVDVNKIKNNTYYLRNQNLNYNNIKKDTLVYLNTKIDEYLKKYPNNISFIKEIDNIKNKYHNEALLNPSNNNYLILAGKFNNSLNKILQYLNLINLMNELKIQTKNNLNKIPTKNENWKTNIIECRLTGGDIDIFHSTLPTLTSGRLPYIGSKEHSDLLEFHRNNKEDILFLHKSQFSRNNVYINTKCSISLYQKSDDEKEYIIDGFIDNLKLNFSKKPPISDYNSETIIKMIDQAIPLKRKKKSKKILCSDYNTLVKCPCLFENFKECKKNILLNQSSFDIIKKFIHKNSPNETFIDKINNKLNQIAKMINPDENHRIYPKCPICNTINYNKYADDNVNSLISVFKHPSENICCNPDCGVTFCSDCEKIHNNFHDSLSPFDLKSEISQFSICRGFTDQNYSQLEKDIGEDQALKCQACPFCRIPIQRKDGCAHVKCPECNKQFCWHCRILKHEENSNKKPHICLCGKHKHNPLFQDLLQYKHNAPDLNT